MYHTDSRGLLCDFHRVQAWMRWLKQSKNAISNKSEALKCMQGLTDANTEDEFAIRLKNLRESSLWASTGSYLDNHWLPMQEVDVTNAFLSREVTKSILRCFKQQSIECDYNL